MQTRDKMLLIEDLLELDSGTLNAEMELESIDSWDSMAKISLMALMDDEFGRKITGEQVRALQTVQDILGLME